MITNRILEIQIDFKAFQPASRILISHCKTIRPIIAEMKRMVLSPESWKAGDKQRF